MDDENSQLTLVQRIRVLEMVFDDLVLSGLLHQPEVRIAAARAINARLAAAAPYDTFLPEIRAALHQHADAMSALDNLPDALKPAARDVLGIRHPDQPDS